MRTARRLLQLCFVAVGLDQQRRHRLDLLPRARAASAVASSRPRPTLLDEIVAPASPRRVASVSTTSVRPLCETSGDASRPRRGQRRRPQCAARECERRGARRSRAEHGQRTGAARPKKALAISVRAPPSRRKKRVKDDGATTAKRTRLRGSPPAPRSAANRDDDGVRHARENALMRGSRVPYDVHKALVDADTPPVGKLRRRQVQEGLSDE